MSRNLAINFLVLKTCSDSYWLTSDKIAKDPQKVTVFYISEIFSSAAQSHREEEILTDFIKEPEYFQNLDLSDINEYDGLSDLALTGHEFSKVETGNEYSLWSEPMSNPANIAETGALRYVFTGDKQAGIKACEALLKLCAFNRWNHPRRNGYTSEGVEIEVDAEEAVDVSVKFPSRPSSVKVNEISVKNWNYEAATGVIKIRLPTGHVVVKMLR
jgi:hypothetical protein